MSYKFFKWNNNYNIDDDIIDQQHQHLFMIFNELLDSAISNEIYSNQDKYNQIYQQLVDYTIFHSKTEEEYMMKNNLADEYVTMHQNMHLQFIKFLKSNLHSSNVQEDVFVLIDFLIRWLIQHVLGVDKLILLQIKFIENGLSSKEAYLKAHQIKYDNTEPLIETIKILYNVVLAKNIEVINKNIELEEKVKLRTKELQEINVKLHDLTMKDSLTNLGNRSYVMNKISDLILQWENRKEIFSIIFLDIDKFKLINDIYGHDNGDMVLLWLANLLKSSIRNTDIACRLGGDEFIVICPSTPKNHAIILAQRIKSIVQNTVFDNYQQWIPSVSVGVASICLKYSTADALLKEADQNMYLDKKNNQEKR